MRINRNKIKMTNDVTLLGMCVCVTDPVDILHLPGGCGNPAATLHDQQDGRGGDHHEPLPLRPRRLPCPLHPKLDLPLLL